MLVGTDESEYAFFEKIALNEQRRLRMMRPESPSHTESIRDAATFQKDDNEFVSLLQKVFSHHEISTFNRIRVEEVSLHSEQSISKWFHQSFFTPVQIARGTSSTNSRLSVEEFFNRLTSCIVDVSSANNIQFLVGDIGDGKTTFLCNVLYRKWDKFSAKGVIPIRFNIDTLNEHKVPPRRQVLITFINATVSWIALNNLAERKDIEYFKNSFRVLEHDSDAVVSEVFGRLLAAIRQRTGKCLLIIIDNIDFLYHIGDRGAFAKDANAEQLDAYESIVDIFRLFSREDQPCANQNMNILFCVRSDTIEYIKSKRGEVPLPELGERAATLVPIASTVDGSLDIMERRFDLLIELSALIGEPAKRAGFISQAEKLRGIYRDKNAKGDRLFNHLWSLSRHGLRDIIDHFSKYSWVEHGRDEGKVALNWRFTGQYSPSILSYALGGKRRYSQFHGSVPNLYLVNAPAPSNEHAVPPEFKQDHFVTYWLKRLILQFLSVKEDCYINTDEIIDVFCGGNRRNYPENLVRYLIGSLSAVPDAECIKVNYGATGTGGQRFYIKSIKITKRGKFLIDEFCESFTYLQLVVDDWRMLIPKKLGAELGYVEPDYRYLIAPGDEYGVMLRKVFEKKVHQTIIFAILLEEYLVQEQILHKNVYNRLREEGVLIPDAGRVIRKVSSDVERIASYLGRHYFDSAYLKHCSPASIDAYRGKVSDVVREMVSEQHYLIEG